MFFEKLTTVYGGPICQDSFFVSLSYSLVSPVRIIFLEGAGGVNGHRPEGRSEAASPVLLPDVSLSLSNLLSCICIFTRTGRDWISGLHSHQIDLSGCVILERLMWSFMIILVYEFSDF